MKFDHSAIKRIRDFHGLSYRKMAKRLGVSVASVYDWEKAKSTPTVNNLDKIIGVFGVEPSFFWVESNTNELD